MASWSEQWLSAQPGVKPSTHHRYGSILRTHIVPAWGRHRLADVSHADVAAWVAGLGASGSAPATVRQTHRVFSLLLALAVRDGRIPRNPADKVPLPRVTRGGQDAGRPGDDRPGGSVLRLWNWRRSLFDPAVRTAGLTDVTPARPAAHRGVPGGRERGHVKLVQRMLGHASAAMTLDAHAALFGDDLGALADRMDAATAAHKKVWHLTTNPRVAETSTVWYCYGV